MRTATAKFILGLLFLLFSTNSSAECIGLITAGGGVDYWKQVERGAHQAAEELGITLFARGAIDSANEQAQFMLIKLFIEDEGCSGLILAANSVDKKKEVAELKSKGIPTVYIDRDIGGERVGVIKTNSFSAGELAGEEMVKALKGRGKVAVFRERENREPTNARENGFIKAARKGGLEVVDVVVGTMVGEVRKNASKVLQNRNDLDGIFTPNESTTTGTIEVLNRAEFWIKKMIHIGFDANDYIVNALQSNRIYGFILQNPYEMGYQSVHAVYLSMTGRQIKTDVEIDVIFVNEKNINTTKIKKRLGLD